MAPVGRIVPEEDQQNVITSEWNEHPKFVEGIRSAKLTKTNLEGEVNQQHLESVPLTEPAIC